MQYRPPPDYKYPMLDIFNRSTNIDNNNITESKLNSLISIYNPQTFALDHNPIRAKLFVT